MKPTLLIADDVLSVRDELHRCLQDDFDIVALSADGPSCLSDYKRYRPGILLLDIVMPLKSGVEVAREIMAMEGEKGPRVVFLTGLRDGEVNREILSELSADIIYKPVDLARLRELLLPV